MSGTVTTAGDSSSPVGGDSSPAASGDPSGYPSGAFAGLGAAIAFPVIAMELLKLNGGAEPLIVPCTGTACTFVKCSLRMLHTRESMTWANVG